MDKYNQLKKVIKKLRKKHSKEITESDENKKQKVKKHIFNFFRVSPSDNKLSSKVLEQRDFRKSIDVAELHRAKFKDDIRDCLSVDMYLRSCDYSTAVSDLTDTARGSVTSDIDQDINFNNSSKSFRSASSAPSLVEQPSVFQLQSPKFTEPFSDTNVLSEPSISNLSVDSVKHIVRTLFNYPDNFYICLSYIITIFLFISIVYVAVQVERLESSLVELLEMDHMNSSYKSFVEYDNRHRMDILRAHRQLTNQVAKMTEVMRNILKKLS